MEVESAPQNILKVTKLFNKRSNISAKDDGMA